jgi:hypothetical protein
MLILSGTYQQHESPFSKNYFFQSTTKKINERLILFLSVSNEQKKKDLSQELNFILFVNLFNGHF